MNAAATRRRGPVQQSAPPQVRGGDVVTSEQIAQAFDRMPSVPPADRRRFPESKAEMQALVQQLHRRLGIAGPSERLTGQQLDLLFQLVGAEFGLRPDFLRYMAGTESGHRQTADNGAAHGIMQIERAAHPEAYRGAINVGNDTISNVVYGARVRAQVDRALADAFRRAGLAPPRRVGILEFLGDLSYNRGPALLDHLARLARAQKIDVDRFADYVAGPNGSFEIRDGKVYAESRTGSSVKTSGQGSVLAQALAEVNRRAPVRLSARSYRDRNNDGQISHLDVWVTRGLRYMEFLQLKAPGGR